MSKLSQTEPDKLISHLRSEVGEIIQSWVIFNIYGFKIREIQTKDLNKDFNDPNIQLLHLVQSKFREDIILRLSELSSTNYNTVNFNYAADKFKIQKTEVKKFRDYLERNHLIFSRNMNIAHKVMSPRWDQLDPSPIIKRRVLTRATAWAVKIMKRFDKEQYGEDYLRIWRLERNRRYEFDMPANVKYMLLPLIRK